MAGRPESYNTEIADRILTEIATTSKSLRSICESPDLPSVKTVLKWLRDKDEFSVQYARAKEEQADMLAEEILELSDKERKTIEVTTSEKGTFETEKDNVQRTRLQIDTRKWLASKLKPKKYGDVKEAEKPNTDSVSFKDFIDKVNKA